MELNFLGAFQSVVPISVSRIVSRLGDDAGNTPTELIVKIDEPVKCISSTIVCLFPLLLSQSIFTVPVKSASKKSFLWNS
jgi:hypothetical protein